MPNDQIIEHLKKLKFIGKFPSNIDVLLVSLPTALSEVRLVEPDITEAKLKNLLKTAEVQVFSNIEDWVKFKTPVKK